MKGVFVHNQLEYRLEVAGEKFCQGDPLPCTLSVKNHGAKTQTIALKLELTTGSLVKMKQRSGDAFTVITAADNLGSITVDPQATQSVSWQCTLDKNCCITDKSHTPCLLFGGSEDGALGQLAVTTLPHRHIQQIVTIFESTFQFIVKGIKSAEGAVQYKMKPSSAKRLTLVDELNLSFHFEESSLILHYLFKVKKIQATATSVGVKKATNEVEQRLEPSTYLLSPEVVNNLAIESVIEPALEVVSVGL